MRRSKKPTIRARDRLARIGICISSRLKRRGDGRHSTQPSVCGAQVPYRGSLENFPKTLDFALRFIDSRGVGEYEMFVEK